ncbi:hypothetical protein [Escherichia coli]
MFSIVSILEAGSAKK